MDIQNQVKNIIIQQGGIAKSADFVAAGISAVQVVSLCNEGFLERVRHGYYSLAEHDTASEEQVLAKLFPKGIVCVESALFHYGYSDFAPRKWSIAVPRSMSRTKLEDNILPLQTYYVQQDIYELGKTNDACSMGVCCMRACQMPSSAWSLHNYCFAICSCDIYESKTARNISSLNNSYIFLPHNTSKYSFNA